MSGGIVPPSCRRRYLRAVATKFERHLDAARAVYERNDPNAALRKLDGARRDALKRRNEDELRRVLDFAEGVIARDERTEIARENVIYALRQNLRQVTRRRAYEDQREWVDPFPDLGSPRPQTRTFVSRGLKFWIGVGVAFGVVFMAVLVAALVAGAFSSGGDELALRVRNDTERFVRLDWCETDSCSGDFDPLSTTRLEPGEYQRRDLPAHDIVDLFVLEDVNGDKVGCLPVRVDRTYEDLPNKKILVVVRVSQATPCPGEIVYPKPVA
jgi:hypothetical protein